MLEKRAEEICEAGLDMLSVSVEGSEIIHDKIRRKRSFERLIEGIEKVLRQPRRPLSIMTTAMSDLTYPFLSSTYDLAKEIGVDGLNVNHLWMETNEMVNQHNKQFPDFPTSPVDWVLEPESVSATQLADSIIEIRKKKQREHFLAFRSAVSQPSKDHRLVSRSANTCELQKCSLWLGPAALMARRQGKTLP